MLALRWPWTCGRSSRRVTEIVHRATPTFSAFWITSWVWWCLVSRVGKQTRAVISILVWRSSTRTRGRALAERLIATGAIQPSKAMRLRIGLLPYDGRDQTPAARGAGPTVGTSGAEVAKPCVGATWH